MVLLLTQRVLVALVLALFASVSAASAQERTTVLLAKFQSTDAASRNVAAAEIRDAFRSNPERFTAQERAVLLEGLESLTVGDSPRYVSTRVVSVLASLGSGDVGRPVDGIPERLASIFERGSDVGVRGAALSALTSQADKAFAFSYLANVAEAEAPQGFPTAPRMAGEILANLGAEGRAVLRRINPVELGPRGGVRKLPRGRGPRGC